MAVCERCTENNNCAWQNHEETICHDAPAFPITNAGRIRTMTDEELAKWIANDLIEPGYYKSGQCEEIWLEWLRQEADNGL